MAKPFYFKFYPGDYLRDTQCLSEAAHVAYDRIMCEHMRNICITYDQINLFTKSLNKAQKSELLMVLIEVEGGFQIQWVAESVSKSYSYSGSRSENRKGKNKNKDDDMNNISTSYDNHMEENTYVKHMDSLTNNYELELKKGGMGENNPNTGVVTWNAEEDILSNKIEFERICMATGKAQDVDSAKESLHKYHLYLQEKENYPKSRKAVFAGFEKWLLNEKNHNGKSTKNAAGYKEQQHNQTEQFLRIFKEHTDKDTGQE